MVKGPLPANGHEPSAGQKQQVEKPQAEVQQPLNKESINRARPFDHGGPVRCRFCWKLRHIERDCRQKQRVAGPVETKGQLWSQENGSRNSKIAAIEVDERRSGLGYCHQQ